MCVCLSAVGMFFGSFCGSGYVSLLFVGVGGVCLFVCMRRCGHLLYCSCMCLCLHVYVCMRLHKSV